MSMARALGSPEFCKVKLSQSVTKYDYIVVRTKSQLGWLNLPHFISHRHTPPVTAITTSGQDSGRSAWGQIDGYRRKTLRKGRF